MDGARDELSCSLGYMVIAVVGCIAFAVVMCKEDLSSFSNPPKLVKKISDSISLLIDYK